MNNCKTKNEWMAHWTTATNRKEATLVWEVHTELAFTKLYKVLK